MDRDHATQNQRFAYRSTNGLAQHAMRTGQQVPPFVLRYNLLPEILCLAHTQILNEVTQDERWFVQCDQMSPHFRQFARTRESLWYRSRFPFDPGVQSINTPILGGEGDSQGAASRGAIRKGLGALANAGGEVHEDGVCTTRLKDRWREWSNLGIDLLCTDHASWFRDHKYKI